MLGPQHPMWWCCKVGPLESDQVMRWGPREQDESPQSLLAPSAKWEVCDLEEDLHQNLTMLEPWPQISGLQNDKKQMLVIYKSPSLWYFGSHELRNCFSPLLDTICWLCTWKLPLLPFPHRWSSPGSAPTIAQGDPNFWRRDTQSQEPDLVGSAFLMFQAGLGLGRAISSSPGSISIYGCTHSCPLRFSPLGKSIRVVKQLHAS